jgi:phosphoglycerate kinase
MTVINMKNVDLTNKRVLIREDLNVPVKNGKVTSDARIRAALPTIKLALAAGAKVMVMSHLGRPTEGQYEDAYSLQPVATHLASLLGQDVPLVKDWLDGVDVESGQLVLVENVRFNLGEANDDDALSRPRTSFNSWRGEVRPNRLCRTIIVSRVRGVRKSVGKTCPPDGGNRWRVESID